MTPPKNSNDQEFTWTVRDIRNLDERFNRIENMIGNNYKLFKEDIKEIKKTLEPKTLVVDNTNKTDWKGIGVIIGATIAAVLAAIQQAIK